MEIVFYLLQTEQPEERDNFLIKLLNRTQKDKHLVDIQLANLEDANWLSQNLWLKPAHGYLPHSINRQEAAPIQLHAPKITQPTKDILINLAPPPYLQEEKVINSYNRLIEIYDQSQNLLENGRENWRAYKQAGYDITVHKIG